MRAELCNLKVTASTQNVEEGTNKKEPPCVRYKRKKPQWPTDPSEKKYINNNYCWLYGYNTSDPHMSETCTWTNEEHIKESMRGNPMGGSQHNKARLWKNDEREVGEILKKLQ